MKRFSVLVSLIVAFVFALTSDTDTKPARWDYRTEAVETALLSQKLTEWGNDRWEVFSVERGDTTLEQDGKTRLKVENFQITARRVLK
jgi:hypothetical protein